MRSVDQTHPSERFLMVAWRLSETGWKRQRDGVLAWLATNPASVTSTQRKQMHTLIATPIGAKACPLVVMHCYADVPTGTRWDLVFDPADPTRVERTSAISRFGVVLDKMAEPTLAHGWHQTAIIEFPDGFPDLIRSLPVDIQNPRFGFAGICDEADFPEIKRSMQSLRNEGN